VIEGRACSAKRPVLSSCSAIRAWLKYVEVLRSLLWTSTLSAQELLLLKGQIIPLHSVARARPALLLVASHKLDTTPRLLAAPPDRNPRYRRRSKIVVGCETGEGSASNKTRNSPFVTPLFSGHTSHLPVFSNTPILPQIALRRSQIL
jgi:hypothetical protein